MNALKRLCHHISQDVSISVFRVFTLREVFYQIQVTTKPSMALYESTIKHSISEDTYTVNDKEISRVNVYGDQPHCVEAEIPMLRPYCYCKIQL